MTDVFAAFESDVIAFDPFAGDFGGSDDKDFSDKMVTAAREHPKCHCCTGPIQKGERHRSKVAKFDGELMTWRWCWACCTAMARSWCPFEDWDNTPYAEITARYAIRFAKDIAA